MCWLQEIDFRDKKKPGQSRYLAARNNSAFFRTLHVSLYLSTLFAVAAVRCRLLHGVAEDLR